MNRAVTVMSMLTVAVFLSGCSALMREPYRQTMRYELSVPEKAKSESCGNVNVQSFRNLSSAGRKIFFREADGRLREAAYTDWAQEPERMIQCALTGSFAGYRTPKAVERAEVNGAIWQFSLDSERKKAYLGVNYEIRCYLKAHEHKTLRGTLQYSAPLESNTGAAAAAAMSKCVEELAQILEQLISKQ